MIGAWGSAYRRAIARGHDHGSAAFIADGAERRSEREGSSPGGPRRKAARGAKRVEPDPKGRATTIGRP